MKIRDLIYRKIDNQPRYFKFVSSRRDFTEIYDKSLGTCYTFNHENGSMHYKLRKPGMQEGCVFSFNL